jgi:hypothetical protein
VGSKARNWWEADRRNAKASKLVRVFLDLGMTSEQVAVLGDRGWADAERAAGIDPDHAASQVTRAEVVEIMRARQRHPTSLFQPGAARN